MNLRRTHSTTQHAPIPMPILIPRAVTPHLFRRITVCSPRCFHSQVRLRGETAAADSVHDQAALEKHVNDYAPPLRMRKHGFGALPMSPLLYEGNARRSRKQSAQRDDTLKDFQKEVALNSYGMYISHRYSLHTMLILPPSTCSRDSYPMLQSHIRAPAVPLPASIYHND